MSRRGVPRSLGGRPARAAAAAIVGLLTLRSAGRATAGVTAIYLGSRVLTRLRVAVVLPRSLVHRRGVLTRFRIVLTRFRVVLTRFRVVLALRVVLLLRRLVRVHRCVLT